MMTSPTTNWVPTKLIPISRTIYIMMWGM
jgi:hypothetical protein